MSLTVTSGIPDSFTVGDAASFTVSSTDYAAPDWTAKIYFKQGPTILSFDATTSGADHRFTLTNANLHQLNPGRWLVAVVYSDGTNRQTTDWREITVYADPTAPTPKSTAAQMVEAIEATILKLSAGTNATASFNGQTFTKKDLRQLREERTYWKAELLREQPSFGCRGRSYATQFVAP